MLEQAAGELLQSAHLEVKYPIDIDQHYGINNQYVVCERLLEAVKTVVTAINSVHKQLTSRRKAA